MDGHLQFMLDNAKWFESVEIAKMERVRDYMYRISRTKDPNKDKEIFIASKENDKRLGTDSTENFSHVQRILRIL